MLTDILLLLLGVLLTAGTALFVAAEFSLVALDPGMVDRRVAAGDKRARGVADSLHHLSTELSSSQVGITLTTILLGYTTQSALVRMLAEPLGDAGLAQAVATTLAVVLAMIVVNGFSMIFGELVPKNMALADPFRTAGVAAPLQRMFTKALHPVITGLNRSANALLHLGGLEAVEEASGGRSAGELAALVRHSAEQGTLDVSTATLLTRSIGIGSLTAVDVMTDRGRMHVLDRGQSAADVVALATTTGHSRFAVVGEDADDVLGIVHLRRAVGVPYERRGEVPVTSSSLMTPATKVPETVALAALLVQLRGEGVQVAVVVDEYGGTSGLVTLEDVVEEIVGEVSDEHDRRRAAAREHPDGTWVVAGTTRPDELAYLAALTVPDDGPYETLGGLVMERLGRIPVAGDVVTVADVELTVEAMDGRRVDRVRVRDVSPPDDEAETGRRRPHDERDALDERQERRARRARGSVRAERDGGAA